eukprot:scaffold4125_cov126-Isochrysis_galbana.AAC.3
MFGEATLCLGVRPYVWRFGRMDSDALCLAMRTCPYVWRGGVGGARLSGQPSVFRGGIGLG